MQNNFVVNNDDSGLRLDAFVLKQMPNLTRSHIKNLIEQQLITIDNKTKKSGEKVKVGQCVCVNLPEPKTLNVEPENLPLDIVYEDDDLAVINKPKGLVVHPANGNDNGTMVNAL